MEIVRVWRYTGELSHLLVVFVGSCFIHPNWIIGRAKEGLDGPLIWLIAATLFSLYSALRCCLFLHAEWPHSVISSRFKPLCPQQGLANTLECTEEGWIQSKALNGTKIREDASVNKVCYVFRLSLVLHLVQQLYTVQLQRRNNSQDVGPAVWLMRYLNSKTFFQLYQECAW